PKKLQILRTYGSAPVHWQHPHRAEYNSQPPDSHKVQRSDTTGYTLQHKSQSSGWRTDGDLHPEHLVPGK
ncbi:hypothetical protein COCVIDRAFT_95957, partial [Bipolaris victoriae FI3]